MPSDPRSPALPRRPDPADAADPALDASARAVGVDDIDPRDEAGLARVWLPWTRRLLRRRLGPAGEEYAGLALLQAIRSYDPSRGVPFRLWASRRVLWTARDAMRHEWKRAGTQAHAAQTSTASLDPDDHDVRAAMLGREVAPPDAALHHDDQTVAALRRIEAMAGVTRWIILGRFLGDLSGPCLERILGHDARHHSRTLRPLREQFRDD